MSFVVDISSVESNISQFPNGIYPARVRKAELDVAKSSGNPIIRMELAVYSDIYGEATLRDTLPAAFPAKVKAFWQAYNDFTPEEIAQHPEVNIADPADLVGAEFLIQLGEQENKATQKTYKTVVAPWYYPMSRAMDLLGDVEDSPIA